MAYPLAVDKFRGCVAVVTGGNGGIGAAIADRLRACGANVEIWDTVKGDDPRYTHEVVDVADTDAPVKALKRLIGRHGKVVFLINNAGYSGNTLPLDEYEPEEWQRIIDITLLGVYHVCRAVIPAMRSASRGRIINVASLAGKEGTANFSANSASKAGVIALTKSVVKGTGAERRSRQCDCAGRRKNRPA